MYLEINQMIYKQGSKIFYLTPPNVSGYITSFRPFSHKRRLACCSNMAPRPLKNKSTIEKGAIAPVPTTTGRQRTLTTKQQLLRKYMRSVALFL